MRLRSYKCLKFEVPSSGAKAPNQVRDASTMADKKVVRFRLADNLAQTHAGFIQKRLFGFLVIPLAIELSLANDN